MRSLAGLDGPRGASLESVLKDRSIWTLSFCAGLFHIFVEYMRPQEKYALFQGLPLGELAFGLLFLAALFGDGVKVTGSAGRLMPALLLWAIIPAALSNNPSRAFTDYGDMLKVVVPYFVILAGIKNPKQLYIFVLWVMGVCFLHTNFSFRMWAATGFVGSGGGAYVGSGFLQNPNDYGAALAAFWGLSLVLGTRDNHVLRRRIPMRLIHRINTGLFLVGVLTSSSRGAALAVLAGAVYYLVVAVPGSKKKIISFALVVMTVGGFMALLSESQSARFEVMGSEEDASAQDRKRTWRIARQIIVDKPVFGVGIGRFLSVARTYPRNGPIFVQHNIVLQAATDVGLPGLALAVAIVLGFFRDQKKILRRLRSPRGDPTMIGIAMGLNVSMVSYLVAGQFITVFWYPFMWTLLIVHGALLDLTSQPRRPVRRRRVVRTAP